MTAPLLFPLDPEPDVDPVLDGLRRTPAPGAWTLSAACRTVPVFVFFPCQSDDPSVAQSICARCPVVADCRDYALSVPGLQGIWGGLTERARRRIRRRRGVGMVGE